MIDLYCIVRFVKGHFYGNQIKLGETKKQRRQTDTTCILCTSVWKRIGISLSICTH